MAPTPENYLAVLKASYDYEPQPDAADELAIKEDQLLFLLEKVDDDWWKVKIKLESQDEEGPAGLVPAAYVEPAQPISTVKALYDYEANAEGELALQEDEILLVYAKDDDWFLVHSQKEGGNIGYIPGNYVEETSGEGEASDPSPAVPSTSGIDFSKLVIPEEPPKPAYTDPTELVNRSKVKAPGGPVETWSISEVDKKGKKKKGTLGVGNGSMFFASESDKTPVQKWQASDIQSTRVEKSKHVHIEVSGPNPAELHFHAGSKEVAEAIIVKLQEARTDAKMEEEQPVAPAPETPPERPRSAAAKSVHFDNSEPEIIPDREEDEVGGEELEVEETEDTLGAGERAVVLYDFIADGDDEMTVHEGETLLVLERDTDEWWKCKNAKGEEGVVPANYLELVPGTGGPQPSVAVEDSKAVREARETSARADAERRAQEDAERKAKERRKAEAEQRAKAAAAQAEADRKRREQERERQKEKEKEREALAAAAERQKQKQKRDSTSENSSSSKSKPSGESSRSSQDRRRPAPEDTRIWHDRTGQFRVEAAFLGYSNGKLRLHKANGVIIEVPSEKMSGEDMAYIEKLNKQRKPSSPRRTSDDETLADRRKSLQPQARSTNQTPKKGPIIDWFEFFLNAGCDVDDCSRYSQSFERDKIDEALLPDITEGTMRSLGLREGDIIRVKKHIDQKYAKGKETDTKAAQLLRDEELARQLQAEENSGASRGQAPNLFAGPNGELKNNVRRGRPQPSKSLPPATVDLNSISTASDQIQRSSTPLVSSPVRTGGTPTPARPKTASPAPAAIASGFDDDAWTNRPASTKPTPSPAPALTRAASVPPAPAPLPVQTMAPSIAMSPPPAQPTPPAPPASAPPAPTMQTNSLANKTEADVFDQLARLAAIRAQSPAVINRPVVSPPTVVSPPPTGYHAGLGIGSSPSPMAQHLQAQQTGILPPPAINGPRGPLAPVPINQSLLQPLVPTPTGLGGGFVPTRQASMSSPFQSSPSPSFLNTQPAGFAGIPQQLGPQPTGFQPPQPLGPQPTGFQPSLSGFQPSSGFQPQATGFQPQPTGFQSQPTGFQPQGPIFSQPTGLPGPGFGNGIGGPFNGLQGNGSLTSVQSNPTGFNPSFSQISSPPPQPQPQSVNTNPANVFAQMKSGTFGTDNNSAPKDASMYP
ncbi:hypothetical protein BDY19DRAFT_928131 [Irpex rosettiformis]|uniref:Uncharacterized protein n=1 Tax=Irpex rosettiformis TaxID=378272 RepID=A0ACB8UCL0_9APHY|nr:hypothetical protein BDY19DRAFT_928131 [Irpex rosettiformis]